MAKPSLTLVQTFYHLAKQGSFSAASRELNLSYQSVANHIRKLEQILDSKLIVSEQGAKRVSLTPKGAILFGILNPELDIMLERIKTLIDKQKAFIRIGVPQGFFLHMFPNIISQFRAKYPDYELSFYERDTALSDLVKNGDVDVLISEQYFGDPILTQRLLGSYNLSLVYPASWGAIKPQDDVAKWMKGRPFITHEPGQTLRNIALDFIKLKGIDITSPISVSSSTSVKRCIEQGFGFGILPSWTVHSNDTDVLSIGLVDLVSVQVYFGVASFLQNNPAVRHLYEMCSAEFSRAVEL
ncbi:LysR family transcriptional regulator [Falsochrobactrum sp. TDYN1]|uniref:LysR family transcriptional regulator n=1 Tax=Falsochrobactrum tianjinense TaxID=2706015 RepID=A0A949PR06_9HYPH|nr:LysR family transcriptional regulator [Falsochrobactrum sp. TDYN1]MBV2145099.1 LysR family transcriptional regulator [Falsochrobactrum sp. TDYN1]